MTQERWTDVDVHLASLYPSDRALDAALQRSREADLPEIAVSPMQGRLLQLLALSIGARAILEVGTLGGYSAIWLARALPADGLLVTLEADAHHAEVARGNIAAAGVTNVDVVVGVAQESMPQLISNQAGPFDMVFIDADKSGYPDYLRWSLELTRPGSIIVGDNVVRHGEILDAQDDNRDVQGIREFNRMVASDPRLFSTIIQTVGVKGHDGLAIAVVRDVTPAPH